MDSQKFKQLFNDFKIKTIKKISLVKCNIEPKVQKGFGLIAKTANEARVKALAAYNVAITLAHESVCKSKTMLYRMQPVVESYSVSAVKQVQIMFAKVSSAIEVASAKVNFNFQHFVMTSGTAMLVFALTFTLTGMNRSKVQAAVLEEEVVETYNEKETAAIDVNYGDDSALVGVAKDILQEKVNHVQEAQPVVLANGEEAYEIGDYIVSIVIPYVTNEDATITIESKEVYEDAIVKTLQDEDLIKEQTYKVKVNYVDTTAPVLTLSTTAVEIDDTESLNATDYVASITDNYDGIMADYTVEGDITRLDDEYLAPGDYTLVYRATDSHGNVGEASLVVSVNETEREEEVEEVVEEKAATKSTATASTGNSAVQKAPDYANAGSIAAAAMAQLGVRQDCTMLVTNSLRAVGINFHSAPRGYFSLGTVVSASEAQPGDIIYYDNAGAGVPHVAIYIGGGQAVHGGWKGNQTAISAANMGSGAVYIRVR